jgi:hypothetical protein
MDHSPNNQQSFSKKQVMRSVLFFIATALALTSAAQNVGIGTTTPTQKLDVAGNINLTGTIMTNGTAGVNGQVLTSTGSGLSWTSIGSQMGYKKCVMLTAGVGSWVVPAGVTEIMVELWGAGSGGTNNCGGSSGGYARTVQTVSPGYSIAYSVGGFGGGGITTSFDGGNSQVTLPSGIVIASGAQGIYAADKKGFSGSGTTTIAGREVFFMCGNMGEATQSAFGMKSSSVYVETVFYGQGGQPVGMFNSRPISGDVIRYENGAQVFKVSGGTGNALPGSGGAAGYPSGFYGGSGLILFWYN